MFSGTSQSGVINLGKISAVDGDVMLIARDVQNSGEISAGNGSVALAAGSEVLVKARGLNGCLSWPVQLTAELRTAV